MASFQLGRLFSDYDVDPQVVQWSGNRLRVGGIVQIGSVDEARAVRLQVNAMNANPDEPFVAVQWDDDPSVDGFYRLLGTECDPGLLHLSDGWLSWSADLERVTDHRYAPLESHCSWQLVTNNRSVSSGTFAGEFVPQHGIPSGSWDYGPVSGTVSGAQSTISSPEVLGPGFGSIITVTNVTIPATGIYGWSVIPENYYHGACLVTTDVGTATDQMVFGRASDITTDWMVSNGKVRFFIENSNQRLTVETWDGTAWRQVSATDYRFQVGGSTCQYQSMTILRNSPECVAVRLSHNISSTKLRVYVDLTLLRASGMVYGHMSIPPTSSNWPTSATMGIQTTASVASTLITGGFRATSADANGHYFIIAVGAPATTDTLASGRTVTTGSTTSFTFGITAALGGTTLAVDKCLEFFARRTETTRVVAR